MTTKKLLLVFVAIMFSLGLQSGPVLAGTVSLPKTGQTTPWSAGDDGYLVKGVVWPTPRFTVDESTSTKTVIDNLTGLEWLQRPIVCFSLSGTTWAAAATAVADFNDGGNGSCGNAGHTDWGLPNVNEWQSLVSAEPGAAVNNRTWLESQGFDFSSVRFYWTSTTSAADSTEAWKMDLVTGEVGPTVKTTTAIYITLVRRATTSAPARVWQTGRSDDGSSDRGVSWPSPRFSDNGNGTITDNLTGLIWLTNADCPALHGSTGVTWTDALENVATLKSGDCGLTDGSNAGDWRLPNRNELRSLVDYSQPAPAVPANSFGDSFAVRDLYWSSTTDWSSNNAPNFTNVWAVFLDEIDPGTITRAYPRSDPAFVLAVKGPDTTPGTYTYDLIKNTGKTSVNAIGYVVDAGLAKAADLYAAVPNIDGLSRWDAATQKYVSYVPGVSSTNFDLVAGEAYFISVSASSSIDLTGTPPAISYTFTKNTGTTSVTAIGLRQGTVSGGTENAAALYAAIPSIDGLSRWERADQKYVSYVPGVSSTNFSLVDGAAYFVSVGANSTW